MDLFEYGREAAKQHEFSTGEIPDEPTYEDYIAAEQYLGRDLTNEEAEEYKDGFESYDG